MIIKHSFLEVAYKTFTKIKFYKLLTLIVINFTQKLQMNLKQSNVLEVNFALQILFHNLLKDVF